mgnify:CR=1 FL=1
MTVERVYLVGFMGAGKSTVGRELSLKLKRPFFDLDAEIEKAEGQPVRAIFEQRGEAAFRALERAHLERMASGPAAIVALGGGAYIAAENRAVVESSGLSVWLDGSFAAIRRRIRPDGSRPLWRDLERARQLYDERRPSYQLARLHVLTDNRLPDAIADEIVRKLDEL